MRKAFQRPGIGSIACRSLRSRCEPGRRRHRRWVGGTSFWDIATNWGSNPLLPGAATTSSSTYRARRPITFRSGTGTIASLAVVGDDMLAITGGSLTVAGSFSAGALTSSTGTLTLNGASTMASLAQAAARSAGTGSSRSPAHRAGSPARRPAPARPATTARWRSAAPAPR